MAAPAAFIPVALDTSGIPRQFADAIARAQRAVKPINLRINSQPLGKITGQVQEFTKSLDASNARVIAFGATTGIIYGLGRAFSFLVKSTIEVEAKLTNISVLLGATSGNMAKMSKELFNIARDTSTAFTDVAEAAEEFARQGLSVAETSKRTRDAMILSKLAVIDAKQAVSDLTAAINTFSREALNSNQIVNKLANVDAAYAVSQKDLADAISRSGAAAQDANVSFDELLATVTSVQQTTSRGGAVIGNALKTIFTRLQRGSTIEALTKIGVVMEDLPGQARPAIDILRDLAQKYQTLGDTQRAQIAEQVGGVHQINVLKALLGDLGRQYSVVDQAIKTSGQSTNEANERILALNKTLKSVISQTGTNITELFSSIGALTIEPVLKSLLNGINGLFDNARGFDTSGFGEQIGQGFLQGIASTIKGPGSVLLIAIFGNLFKKVAQFGIKSVADLAGLNKVAAAQAGVQEQINNLLSTGNAFYVARYNAARTVQEQEQAILNLIRVQNSELQKRSSTAAAVAPYISGRGSFNADTRVFKPKAAGHIPAMAQESQMIRSGVGGAHSSAKPVPIPNFNFGGGKKGHVVANTSELIVQNFAGSGGDAIFNPKMIQAIGGASKLKGLGKISKVAANGLVPNFAKTFKTMFGEAQYSVIGKSAKIEDIRSYDKGGGNAKFIYEDLFKELKGEGASTVTGYLVPQLNRKPRSTNPVDIIKSIFPQVTRGRFAKDSEMTINGETFKFGGKTFDADLAAHAPTIVDEFRHGGIHAMNSVRLVSNLANGFVPNFANKYAREDKGYESMLLDKNYQYVFVASNPSKDERIAARKKGVELMGENDLKFVMENQGALKGHKLNIVDPSGGFSKSYYHDIDKAFNVQATAKGVNFNKFQEAGLLGLQKSLSFDSFLESRGLKLNHKNKILSAAKEALGDSFFLKAKTGANSFQNDNGQVTHSSNLKDKLSSLKKDDIGKYFLQKAVPNSAESSEEYRVAIAGVGKKAVRLGSVIGREEYAADTLSLKDAVRGKGGNISDYLARSIADSQARRSFSQLGKDNIGGLSAGFDVIRTGNTGLKLFGQYLAEKVGLGDKILRGGGVIEGNFTFDDGRTTGTSGATTRGDIATEAGLALLKNKKIQNRKRGLFFADGFVPSLARAVNTERSLTGESPKIGFDSRLSGGVGVYSPSQGSLSNAIGQHLRDEPGRNLRNLNDTGKQYQNAAGGIPSFAPLSSFSVADQAALQQMMQSLQAAARANLEAAKASERSQKRNELIAKAGAGEPLTTRDKQFLYGDARRQAAGSVGLSRGGERFLGRLDEGAQLIDRIVNAPASKSVIQTNRLSQSKALEKDISEFFDKQARKTAFTPIGLESGLRKTIAGRGITVEQNKINENRIADITSDRRTRRNHALFGASFALPIVAQSLSALGGVDPTSQAGRRTAGITEAAATGGTIASLLPNKAGVGIGLGIGSVQAIRAITTTVTTSMEEFSKKIQESNNYLSEQNNAVSGTINAFDNLRNIIEQGGSQGAVDRSTAVLGENFSQLRGKKRGEFLSALGARDTEKLRDIQARELFTSNRITKTNNFAEKLATQNEKAGTTGNYITESLIPSRRNVLAAFEDTEGNDNFGKRLTRSLFGTFSGGGPGNAVDKLKNLKDPTFKALDEQLALVPFDVKNIDVNKARQNQAGGGDPRKILESFFTDSGITGGNIGEAISGTTTADASKFLENALKRLEESKKSAEALSKTGAVFKNASRLIEVSKDILEDISFAMDYKNLDRQAAIANSQLRGQGFLQQNSGSLTDKAKVQGQFLIDQSQTVGSLQNEVSGVISSSLKKLQIPSEKLDDANVSKRISEMVASIIKDPNSVVTKFKELADILEGGKAGEDVSRRFREAGNDVSRDLAITLKKGNIEQAKNLLNRSIGLAGVDKDRQRNFLGGNFRDMVNPDFSNIQRGFAAFGSRSGLGSPIIDPRSSNLDRFFGGRRDSIAEQRRDTSVYTDQANSIIDLEKLGLLPQEGEQRDKFREIIEKAISGNMSSALDQLSLNAPAEFQDILKTARGQVGSAAKTQAADLLPGNKGIAALGASLGAPLVEGNKQVSDVANTIQGITENTLKLSNVNDQLLGLTNVMAPLRDSITQLDASIKKATGQQPTEAPTTPTQAAGWIPNFSAFAREMRDIRAGVGGARIGDKPVSTHIAGLGSAVVNTGENVVRNFMGSGKDAVFNRSMTNAFGGSLSSLGRVDNFSKGFVPNFALDDAGIGETKIETRGVDKLGNAVIKTQIVNQKGKVLRSFEKLVPKTVSAPTTLPKPPISLPSKPAVIAPPVTSLPKPPISLPSRPAVIPPRPTTIAAPPSLRAAIGIPMPAPSVPRARFNIAPTVASPSVGARLAGFGKGIGRGVGSVAGVAKTGLYTGLANVAGNAFSDIMFGNTADDDISGNNNSNFRYTKREAVSDVTGSLAALKFGGQKGLAAYGTYRLGQEGGQYFGNKVGGLTGDIIENLGTTAGSIGAGYVAGGVPGAIFGGGADIVKNVSSIYSNYDDYTQFQNLTSDVDSNKQLLALRETNPALFAQIQQKRLARRKNRFAAQAAVAQTQEAQMTAETRAAAAAEQAPIIGKMSGSTNIKALDAQARRKGFRSFEQLMAYKSDPNYELGGPTRSEATINIPNVSQDGFTNSLINRVNANTSSSAGYGSSVFDEFNSPAYSLPSSIIDETEEERKKRLARGLASGFIPNFSALNMGAYGRTGRGQRGSVRHVGPLTQIQRMIQGGNFIEAKESIFGGGLPSSFRDAGLDSNNLTGVARAIQREQEALTKRGIPTNLAAGSIFVGHHNLAGGLAVGNYFDEPAGRYNASAGILQGINRVRNEGGNPRSAGRVPNYAADNTFDELTAAIQDLITVLQDQQNDKEQGSAATGADNTVTVDHNINVNATVNGEVNSANSEVQAIVTAKLAELQAQLQALQASQKDNRNFVPKPPTAPQTPIQV